MGICGYINNSEKIRNDKVILDMTKSINKRICSISNIYIHNNLAFGHTKQIIGDLLSENQPFTYDYNSNTYTIVFNGELYNSDEIKRELLESGFCFKTNSDSESVLFSYIAHKEKCLDKLDGVFSFAIYSKKENLLFLARDRLGVKPLFYTITNNTLVFASEIKSILTHPYVKAKVRSKRINGINWTRTCAHTR